MTKEDIIALTKERLDYWNRCLIEKQEEIKKLEEWIREEKQVLKEQRQKGD